MSFTLSNTGGHLAMLLRSRTTLWDGADPDSLRLARRISVAVPTWKWRVVLEFDVVVILSLIEDGGPDNTVRVTWKSADGRRFPSFDGVLRLERDEVRNCRLVLEGGYDEAASFEPYGNPTLLDHRICVCTATALLEVVRNLLEMEIQTKPLALAGKPPGKRRRAALAPAPTLFD